MTSADILALISLALSGALAAGAVVGARRGAWLLAYALPLVALFLYGVFFTSIRFGRLHWGWPIDVDTLNRVSTIWRLFSLMLSNVYLYIIYRQRMEGDV